MNSRPSIKNVAELAGVSISAVSQILNGKGSRFSLKTIRKVREAKDELGYVPNQIAQNLKSKNVRTLGVVVPNLTNPYFASLIQGMIDASDEHYNVLVFGKEKTDFLVSIKDLMAKNVDGLIIGVPLNENPEIEELVDKLHIPHLQIDQTDAPETSDYIENNDSKGGSMAAQHLLDLHHKKVAIVEPVPEHSSRNINRRVTAFATTIQQGGGEIVALLKGPDLNIDSGYKCAQAVIDSKATAVFAVNDDMALGLMKGLHDLGCEVPENISVVGYDGVKYGWLFNPTLTTVRQPSYDLGKKAIEILKERILHPEFPPHREILGVEIVIGESTRSI